MFGLSEKHTKFEKNLPRGLDVMHEEDCANFYVLYYSKKLNVLCNQSFIYNMYGVKFSERNRLNRTCILKK